MDLSELTHRINSIRRVLRGAYLSRPMGMAATAYSEMAVNGVFIGHFWLPQRVSD